MKKLYFIFLLASALYGCTKEIPEKIYSAADLTGYWNGYGYGDFKGPVPLEVIRIDKYNDDSLVAIKIVGDNAIKAGMLTWTGRYNGNPFKVLWQGNTGSIIAYFSSEMTVVNANTLKSNGMVFIRRSDEFHP